MKRGNNTSAFKINTQRVIKKTVQGPGIFLAFIIILLAVVAVHDCIFKGNQTALGKNPNGEDSKQRVKNLSGNEMWKIARKVQREQTIEELKIKLKEKKDETFMFQGATQNEKWLENDTLLQNLENDTEEDINTKKVFIGFREEVFTMMSN